MSKHLLTLTLVTIVITGFVSHISANESAGCLKLDDFVIDDWHKA